MGHNGDGMVFAEITEDVGKSPAARYGRELTERQLAVLRLIAQGNSNGEMARVLGVSPNTIRSHILAILAKLGARNREHAVHLAHRDGLLR